MDDVEKESWHRVEAMRFRAQAQAARDPRLKAAFLRIAKQHDKIADHLAEIARAMD